MIVQKSAAAPRCGEEVVVHRIVNHALRNLSFVLQGNRNAILRKAVQEIGGAVEWIDDPQLFGVRVGVFGGAFLC